MKGMYNTRLEEEKRTVRICSENGDVEFVVANFKRDVLETWPDINFKHATITQRLASIASADKSSPDFYPLKLYSDTLEVMVSEVRCGYRGASPDALVEILNLAGFNLKQNILDKIYNEQNLNIIICRDECLSPT